MEASWSDTSGSGPVREVDNVENMNCIMNEPGEDEGIVLLQD